MHAKNDEAQKCANTLGLLSNKSGKESIDMNSVHNNELTFQQTEFHPVSHAGETWLTSSELAAALGYKNQMPLPKYSVGITMNLLNICQRPSK
jgi:prophage antirepressor-like protein